MLEISTAVEDGFRSISPAGKIDSRTSPEFDAALNEQISEGGGRFLLDFTAVEFVSSAGLRVLLVAAKRIRDLDGRMVITAPQSAVIRVMEISGFTKMLNVVIDPDEARASLRD